MLSVGTRDPPCLPGGDGPELGRLGPGLLGAGGTACPCSLPARPVSLRCEACEVTTTLSPYCSYSPSKATASQRLQGWVTWGRRAVQGLGRPALEPEW